MKNKGKIIIIIIIFTIITFFESVDCPSSSMLTIFLKTSSLLKYTSLLALFALSPLNANAGLFGITRFC